MSPPAPRWEDCWAHTDDAGAPADRLAAHLAKVAGQALESVAAARPEVGRLAAAGALLHDTGKATPWFQAYLLGDTPRSKCTRHSLQGALLAGALARDWPPDLRAALVQSVLRHHGRPDCGPGEEVDRLRRKLAHEEGARDLAEALLSGLDLVGLLRFVDRQGARLSVGFAAPDLDVAAVLAAATPNALAARRQRLPPRNLDGFVRDWTAYGALLAADRIDAATAGAERSRAAVLPESVARYAAARFPGSPVDGSLGALRDGLARDVRRELLAHEEGRLFTLTAPTGSGKTLAAIGAALATRPRRPDAARRLVYALPFTSVIDQNHAVLAEVLAPDSAAVASDVLLKHHHRAGRSYRTSDDEEYTPDGAGRLLVETWQSEVVVTTFHQVLHTFLSGHPRDATRAPAWAGATLILDEVQAIPLAYWRAVGRLLEAAAGTLDTTVILMTATRPLLFAPGVARELVPNHQQLFERLDRVDLSLEHGRSWTVRDVADRAAAAAETGSVLAVVNTKAAVRAVWSALRERLGARVRALSSALTPRDRRARIESVGAALEAAGRPALVSTQMVEAGVDLSFATVLRDLAPIDSVIQSAGRCNRHGEGPRGEVVLLSMEALEGSGRSPARQVYDSLLLDAAKDALFVVAAGRCRLSEPEFLPLSDAYFEACATRASHVDVDVLAAEGRYAKLAAEFQLIPSRGAVASWFVPQDARARELWALWEAGRPEDAAATLDTLALAARARLRRVRHEFADYLVQESIRGAESPPIRLVPDGRYDPELGLLPEGDPW